MQSHEGADGSGKGSYGRLALSLSLSLIVMFLLMMPFVARWDDYYLSLSNFYMAVLMVAPMGLIMLVVMRGMFPNRRLNIGLAIGFVALFIVAFGMGRNQVFVGNDSFLRGMIPHHSQAVLMCQEASITDPDIEQLCQQIIASQEEEIDIMQRMLDEE